VAGKESTMSITGLTPRELEVLKLKAAGMTGREIARVLYVSPQTVKNHVRNILRKLEVCNSIAAVLIAVRDGDIDPDELEVVRRWYS
jgi:DNA-binding NarL/FixJ family response regulator